MNGWCIKSFLSILYIVQTYIPILCVHDVTVCLQDSRAYVDVHNAQCWVLG